MIVFINGKLHFPEMRPHGGCVRFIAILGKSAITSELAAYETRGKRGVHD
jgi:hypothetical protein